MEFFGVVAVGVLSWSFSGFESVCWSLRKAPHSRPWASSSYWLASEPKNSRSKQGHCLICLKYLAICLEQSLPKSCGFSVSFYHLHVDSLWQSPTVSGIEPFEWVRTSSIQAHIIACALYYLGSTTGGNADTWLEETEVTLSWVSARFETIWLRTFQDC